MDDRGPSGESVVPLVQSGSVSTRPSTATDWNSMTSGGGDRGRTVEQVDEMATNGTVLNLKARFLMHLNMRNFPEALKAAEELSALEPGDATVEEFQVVLRKWMDLLYTRIDDDHDDDDDDDDDEEEEESSEKSSSDGEDD